MSAATAAPELEAASLAAIEQALNGGGGASDFGDSLSFASGGRIGGTAKAGSLEEKIENAFNMAEIDQKFRRAAYSIIHGKGATYYGIGSALSRIVDVILHDQRAIFTVCAPAAEVCGVEDLTMALPRLVGGDGVRETCPLPLNELESRLLRSSAEKVRLALDGL